MSSRTVACCVSRHLRSGFGQVKSLIAMLRPKELQVKEFLREGEKVPALPQYKKPKPKRLTSEQVAYFCRTTTSHGVAHIVDKNEYSGLRIMWAVMTLVFAITVVTLINLSLRNLVSKRLTTEFLVARVEKGPVDLPDIHICDTSIFNATRLKEMGFKSNISTYLILATSENSAKNHVFTNNTIEKDYKEPFEHILAVNNWTIRDVMERAAIKDTVWHCSHDGTDYEGERCCEEFFAPVTFVSIFGSCISTHGRKINQTNPTRDAGFAVYTKPNKNDILVFDGRIIKGEYILQKGLYYAVSSPAVNIESVLHTDGRFAAPNSWVSVPITKKVIDNSELKDQLLAPHTCVDTKDSNYIQLLAPQYEYYSADNCRTSYKQNYYRKHGNCSAAFYKHEPSDRLCDPYTIRTYANHDNTYCPIECITETYEGSPSNAQFNTDQLGRKYDELLRSEPVVLHFFYPRFEYQLLTNHPNTLLKWLGEVGGHLGLFMGASLISILEILVLFIRCCLKSSSSG